MESILKDKLEIVLKEDIDGNKIKYVKWEDEEGLETLSSLSYVNKIFGKVDFNKQSFLEATPFDTWKENIEQWDNLGLFS